VLHLGKLKRPSRLHASVIAAPRLAGWPPHTSASYTKFPGKWLPYPSHKPKPATIHRDDVQAASDDYLQTNASTKPANILPQFLLHPVVEFACPDSSLGESPKSAGKKDTISTNFQKSLIETDFPNSP
jgi:hypothetical protein